LVPRLTALAGSAHLAAALQQRLDGCGMHVVHGDGAAMPFAEGTFSGVVAFTMLHHIATPDLQNRLIAEARRVLRPGRGLCRL
jgi:SAM-dependent methyltransferase